MDNLDLIIESSILKIEQAQIDGEQEMQPEDPNAQEQMAPPQGTEEDPEASQMEDPNAMGGDPSMMGGDPSMMGMDPYGQPQSYDPPDKIEEPLDIDSVAPDPKKIKPITVDD